MDTNGSIAYHLSGTPSRHLPRSHPRFARVFAPPNQSSLLPVDRLVNWLRRAEDTCGLARDPVGAHSRTLVPTVPVGRLGNHGVPIWVIQCHCSIASQALPLRQYSWESGQTVRNVTCRKANVHVTPSL